MKGYVKIFTYGCQMNDLDTQKMYSLLAQDGWQPTERTAKADLIILNTCTVREKATQKALSNLGRLRENKQAKPELIIAVAGCVAQQEGLNLRRKLPFIDIVLGTHQLHRLNELVEEERRQRRPLAATECYTEMVPGLEIIPDQRFASAQHRAYLNIMQGCNNFCTYCIVPYVRGREISRPVASILDEVRQVTADGAKEIFLLGQNVNSYAGGASFTELLREIHAIEGVQRLRFTTSHPKDMSPELIECFNALPKLCHYLHLPFQSGSNRVLKAMHRSYSREHYLELIARLRQAAPELAFSADVIVGFPGESESEFMETMELIEQVRFDNLFSFKYSPRPGTKAAELPDDVSRAEKERRLEILQSRQKQITLENNQARVGKIYDVLVDARSKRDTSQLNGRTTHNLIVNFAGAPELLGQTVKVRITQANQNSLVGELV
ncbi:MAG: (Dimethylallyl)adenosine tRNA methylthiotransferase MiaB [Deltaproteobacteria bacterium ADurb.Bin510]|nr:MAG: (Dimethylallyl)adenosine tRNA methylthiotransferase MiaB [Deltaproteobacteria bacterium ADurb.Bin510]